MFIRAINTKVLAAAGIIAMAATAGCSPSPATDLLTYETTPGAASLETKTEDTLTGSTTSCVTFGTGESQQIVAFPVGSKWQGNTIVLPDGKKIETGKLITFSGGQLSKESLDRLNPVANCPTEGKNVWVFEPFDA